jgi:hypothetical protein
MIGAVLWTRRRTLYNSCDIIFIGITPGVHVTVILPNAAVVGKLLTSLFSPTSSVENCFRS